jgi:hypothetical protein
MNDPTESIRREMLETNQPYQDLARAEQRWDTQQLGAEFVVHSFLAPFVLVTRKSDGKRGTLEFTHSPRFYFNFVPD